MIVECLVVGFFCLFLFLRKRFALWAFTEWKNFFKMNILYWLNLCSSLSKTPFCVVSGFCFGWLFFKTRQSFLLKDQCVLYFVVKVNGGYKGTRHFGYNRYCTVEKMSPMYRSRSHLKTQVHHIYKIVNSVNRNNHNLLTLCIVLAKHLYCILFSLNTKMYFFSTRVAVWHSTLNKASLVSPFHNILIVYYYWGMMIEGE